MNDVQILCSNKSGFDVLHRFEGWQIGEIKYHDGLEKATLERLEKHNTTDEIFVLLFGNASLYIGKELKETQLKQGCVYNVPKGVWHTITLSKDAKVIVFENVYTEVNDKVKFKD